METNPPSLLLDEILLEKGVDVQFCLSLCFPNGKKPCIACKSKTTKIHMSPGIADYKSVSKNHGISKQVQVVWRSQKTANTESNLP